MIKQLDGTLVYCMIDRAVDCWDKTKGKEFKCGVVLTDEDEADAFDEAYPKQTSKKVKAVEFEEIYKCPVPEGAGKNVWVVTLKKNEKLANGEPVPDKYKPHVFLLDDEGKTDITLTKLVANGSKGAITIDHYSGEKGNVARLKNVFVTELIEYVKPEGSSYESGDEYEPTGKVTKVNESKVEPAKPAKATKKAVKTDDDSPF